MPAIELRFAEIDGRNRVAYLGYYEYQWWCVDTILTIENKMYLLQDLSLEDQEELSHEQQTGNRLCH